MPQIRLISEKQKVQAEVVDLLRRLLSEAEAGDIDGLFGVVTYPGGDQETVCSASLSTSQKMGAMMQAIIDLAAARGKD